MEERKKLDYFPVYREIENGYLFLGGLYGKAI